ncbi:hypothetical protein BT93_C0183 [Corymbia citriodora subsp. variegata]|nr:hypothetical protein BT93_C0183 [Corymbia citriodora subsp. variegata]
MELPMLLSFVQTLIEAHKLFLRNGRLMVSIAASTVLLYSLLLLTNIFSLRPAVGHLIANTSMLLITSPTSTEYSYLLMSIQKDIRLFYGLEWVFVLLYSVCSILFSTMTIYASAAAHGGKNLSTKDLGIAVARSWRRPFITFFYITLFGIGYLFLVLALTIPLVLPRANIATVILCIVAALFYAHLAVVWTLGLVVSVLEEDKSGLGALAKAGQLVKGREVHGFALSLVIVALSILMSQVVRLVSVRQSEGAYIVIGLVMLNLLWAVRMFGLMAYTVFYYECKKFHGEESNALMVSLEYSKIPANTPLITENLP